jgi:anti-anti-sigma factor
MSREYDSRTSRDTPPVDREGDTALRHAIEKAGDDVIIVRVSGDVDAYTAPSLREAFGAAEKAEARLILVDLAKVPYIDSTGVGVINGAATRAANAGGRVVIAAAEPQVRKVFEITGLVKRIELHPDEASALASLREPRGGARDGSA